MIKNHGKVREDNGFTLIELLVVVAIIGVLATVVVVSLTGAQKKSRDSKRKSDVAAIKLSMDSFYVDNHRYPICDNTTECKFSNITNSNERSINDTNKTIIADDITKITTYLPVFPKDPTVKRNGLPAYYAYADSDSNALGNQSYSIGVALEVAEGDDPYELEISGKTYYLCKSSTSGLDVMWETWPKCDF